MKPGSSIASLVRRVVLFGALLVLACGPGGDAPQPPPPAGAFAGCGPSDLTKIAPLLTCVTTIAGTNYAVFGYRNDGEAAFLPHGAENDLIRPPGDTPTWSGIGSARPPTAFTAGTRADALVTPFATQVRWQLGGSSVEATAASSPSCGVRKESGTTYVDIPSTPGAPPTAVPVWRDDGIGQIGAIVPTQAPVMQGNAIGTVPGSFAVNEDGAATFQLPLWAPQGTAGMQPSLALAYNSRHANGLLGVGWTLSGLSQIARCAKTQQNELEPTEVRFDDTDRFCLDGDFLTRVPAGNDEYRPQHDPYARVRITSKDALGPTAFSVETKDGRVLHYGAGSARLEGPRFVPNATETGAVIDSSTNPSVRLTWFLDESRDRVGNAVRYSYEDKVSVPHHLCAVSGACVAQEKRIHEITYTHFGDAPVTRKVAFFYEDRPDRELIYVSGFPIWRSGRLQRIEMHGPAPTAAALLKQYRLAYHAEGASVSGRSLLATVSECDAANTCKVPRTFEYEAGDPGFEVGETLTGPNHTPLFPSDPNHSNLVVADFDGDGRDDLLYVASGSNNWYLRLGIDRTFGPPIRVDRPIDMPIYAGATGRRPMPVAVDWDMDGKVDIAWPFKTFYPTYPTGPDSQRVEGSYYRILTWERSTSKFVPLIGAPEPTGSAGVVAAPAFGDLDGDGRPEWLAPAGTTTGGSSDYRTIVRSIHPDYRDETGPGIYSNAGLFIGDFPAVTAAVLHSGPTAPGVTYKTRRARYERRTHPTSGESYLVLLGFDNDTPVPATGEALTFADFNGDGLADIFEQVVGSDRYAVSINTGAGYKRLSFSSTFVVWGPQHMRAVVPLDYRESGQPDMFLVGGRVLPERPRLLRFGVKGSGAAAELDHKAIEVPGLPHFFPLSGKEPLLAQLHVLDANGDGLDDLLVPDTDTGLLTLHVRKGKKADLLTKIGNGLGDQTEVRYAPLQTPSKSCAYPLKCSIRGVWVVGGWKEHTQDSKSLREWSLAYSDPVTDLQGAGFLGFGSRWKLDHQTGEQTTVRFDRLAERAHGIYAFLRVPTSVESTITVGGQKITRLSTIEYELGTAGGASPIAVVALPKRVTELATEKKGATTTTLRNVEVTYDERDAFGNVTRQTFRANGAGVIEETRTTFRNDEPRWLLGLPEQQTVTSTVPLIAAFDPFRGTQTTKTGFVVDGETGLLKQVIVEPDGAADVRLETTYVRNARSAITSTIEMDGFGRRRQTDVAWNDDASFPTAIVDALGHVRRVAYHAGFGVVAEAVAPNGVVARFQYDGMGHLRRALPPRCLSGSCPASEAELTLDHEAAPSGYAIRSSRKGGQSALDVYDALERIAKREWTAFAEKGEASFTYDRSFVDRVSDAFYKVGGSGSGGIGGAFLAYGTRYDGAGRTISVTSPKNGTTNYTYEGLRVTVRDAVGATAYTVSDELGHLVRSVNVEGTSLEFSGEFPPKPTMTDIENTTQYVFGPFGRLIQIADAKRNLTNLIYDVRGRRTVLDDPDTGRTQTAFDAFGNAVRMTDALGRVTEFATDASGRVVAKRSADGLSCYGYDGSAAAIGQLSASIFKPADSTAPTIARLFEHDGLGRVVHESQQTGGASPLKTAHTYDEFGRLQALTYPNGFVAKHEYTPAGFLQQITTGDGALLWREQKQDALGRTEVEVLGDGYITNYGYQPGSGLLRNAVTWAVFGPVTQNISYSWYADGLMKSRVDAASGGAQENFAYDKLKRLTKWSSARGKWAVTYAYDSLGNLTSRDTNGPASAATTETFVPGPSGPRVGGVIWPSGEALKPPHGVLKGPAGDYDYDSVGDQIVGPGRTVQWTSFHLPKRITAGGRTVRYHYDAHEQRAQMVDVDSGDVTTYFGAGYEERTNALGTAASEVAYVSNGARVVAQVTRDVAISGTARTEVAKKTVFLHSDLLGSGEVLQDSLGAVVERRHFEPFGRSVDPASPTTVVAGPGPDVRVGFTGHEHEAGLGLINMRGRMYEPGTARFLTADPIVTEPSFGQALNRYSYVLNSPVNFVDPSGFSFVDAGGGAGTNPNAGSPFHIQVGGSPGGVSGGCGKCVTPNFTPAAPCPPRTPPTAVNVTPFTDAGGARSAPTGPANTQVFTGGGGTIDLEYQEGWERWWIVEAPIVAKRLAETSLAVLSIAYGVAEVGLVAGEAVVVGRVVASGAWTIGRGISSWGARVLPSVARATAAAASRVGTGVAKMFDGSRTSQRGVLVLPGGGGGAMPGGGGPRPAPAWITPGSLPPAEESSVLRTLGHIDGGTVPTGATSTKWGHPFKNWAGDLPGASGPGSPYLEYRVAPVGGGTGAGTLRIVVDDVTGAMYYTWTHYGTAPEAPGSPPFVRIR